MTNLDDGFGPFVPRQLDLGLVNNTLIVNEVKSVKDKHISTYSEAIEAKAEEELQSIRDKTHEESKLKAKAKDLQSRIDKTYTKSRNPVVRDKYKKIRDGLKMELKHIEDQLVDYQMNRK